MHFIVLLGRILFSAIFILASLGHFSAGAIEYSMREGVPMASLLVPLSGVIGLLGAVSILVGYKARLGAWLIVIFLVPITFAMHKFWAMSDPISTQIQQAMFLKNMSMLGAALLIAYFGSGPMSIDKQKKK
jgi:putative oxidoreductase